MKAFCTVCHGPFDRDELVRGKCFECRVKMEQEKMRICREREVGKIIADKAYQRKKKDELKKSLWRVLMYNLKAKGGA